MILKCLTFANLCLGAFIIALTLVHWLPSGKIPSESSWKNVSYVHVFNSENISTRSSFTEKINKGHTLDKNFQNKTTKFNIILNRKRRYLVFPEGSSFQLVFDLIIPIVDYTNYAIMGITCAVAWALPSEPPSEIKQNLLEKLNDGTYGLSRNDSVDNIQYVDVKDHRNPKDSGLIKMFKRPVGHTYNAAPLQTVSYTKTKIYSDKTVNYNRYKYSPFDTRKNKKSRNEFPSNYKQHTHGMINNEMTGPENTAFSWKSIYTKRPVFKKTFEEPSIVDQSSRWENIRPKERQHEVYHIMGKRNVKESNQWLNELHRINLKHHRSSRHALYSKVEAMFNQHGKNGKECVSKFLCETGQRRHDTEPQGLLTEILRTIFTLPKLNDEILEKETYTTHGAWDAAHGTDGNCSKIYSLCENSIWNSQFFF